MYRFSQSPYKGFNSVMMAENLLWNGSQSPYKGFNRIWQNTNTKKLITLNPPIRGSIVEYAKLLKVSHYTLSIPL